MDEQEWQSFVEFEEERSAAERKLNPPDNMQIFVQTIDDKIILVNDRPTSTVANIKNIVRTIATRFCGPDNFLIFGGKILEDELTVADIGLQKGAFLIEIGRLRGGAPTTRRKSFVTAGNFNPAETDKAHDEDPAPTPSVRLADVLQDVK